MKLNYRPEIDGLRAIAVGAVILYHAQINILGYQPFKGGFIGVDIFFVISGYLISSIILKELKMKGTFSFKYFYERRIRRILPVLLVVMLTTLPFAWIYFLPNDFIDFSKSVLYSLGFSSNLHFHYSSQIYGATDGLLKPFLHTWSLSVEEQYYIIFPIILIITFKYFKKYILNILIIGFVISLGFAEWTSRNYQSVSFYFLHTRMWELLAGSILSYLEIIKGYKNRNQTLNLILPFVGLLIIIHSIIFFNDKMLHPSFYTLSPILGVCLIIWFAHKNEIITKILSTKLFVGVGLISYSLYLWHYPIFSFVRYYNLYFKNYEEVTPLISKIFFILLILFLSIISFFFIEKKFRNKKFKFSKIILISSSCFVLLLILNSFVIFTDGYKNRFHPFIYKYEGERINFKKNYDFNEFNYRKNVIIIGDSYSDDLLRTFFYNDKLQKEYYFYVGLADNRENFQLKCLKGFLKKNTSLCNKQTFNNFEKQFEKSNYIIFAVQDNSFYLKPKFIDTIKLLEENDRNFIVFLNDLGDARILDRYILQKKRVPVDNELTNLEKKFFANSKKLQKNEIQFIENKFKTYDINFLFRSELFCSYSEETCSLIKKNNKIYSDSGHLTNNGAKFFSDEIKTILDRIKN